MEKSRYSFAIMSTGRRPDKTTEPQLVVTTTKGTFKLNGSATRLIGLQHGDHAALVNNEADILHAVVAGDLEEGTPVTWGIMKGLVAMDKDGNARKSIKRLSDSEVEDLIEDGQVDDDGQVLVQYEDKIEGFKLAATNKAMGLGNTLQGSDAVNHPALGGNSDNNVIYDIETEPTPVDIDGRSVDVFILGDSTMTPKIKRG